MYWCMIWLCMVVLGLRTFSMSAAILCDRDWYCVWWLIGTVSELFAGLVYHVFDIVWEWWDVGEMG